MSFTSAGVIGAGSWGTALAVLLAENGLPVRLWGRNEGQMAAMAEARVNEAYLPGILLPAGVEPTARLGELAGCDLVLFVTPSQAMEEAARRFAECAPRGDAVLLSCTKGIERGSGRRMSEIVAEQLTGNPVAILSGPGHAEEVARKAPTAIVLGSADAVLGERLQRVFTCPHFRAYTSADIAGIELGGALKNIYAIAAGAVDGLGLGDNSKAALVTRALAEMTRLGVALGGCRETFTGLSGIGDLMVTCYSRHSRNHAVGERLGRGESIEEIRASMRMVAEGVPTALSAHEAARAHGIETPIIEQVHEVLYAGKSPAKALSELMGRDPKPE